jgi:hypothetical protein
MLRDLSLVPVLLQCYQSIRVGALAAVGVVVVEEVATIAPCSRRRRRRHTKYRPRGQETWTICRVVVAVCWGPAGAQRLDTDIRRGPKLQILPQLYITPRPVSRLWNIFKGKVKKEKSYSFDEISNIRTLDTTVCSQWNVVMFYWYNNLRHRCFRLTMKNTCIIVWKDCCSCRVCGSQWSQQIALQTTVNVFYDANKRWHHLLLSKLKWLCPGWMRMWWRAANRGTYLLGL